MRRNEDNIRSPVIGISSVIICDDARREDNGKDILIGVYSGDIIVPSFPAALGLSFWFEYSFDRPGVQDIKFRVVTDRGTELFGVGFKVQVEGQNQSGSFSVGPVAIPMTDPGVLSVQMQQGEDDWSTLKSKIVRKGPPIQIAKQ